MADKQKLDIKVLVAAIDFGTTYSGYAFSFKDEYEKDPTKIMANTTWVAGHKNLFSQKTPTCLLLKSDRSFHSFGYEAEDTYTGLANEGKHHSWYFFRRFKMMLHNNMTLNRETVIADDSGQKKLPAMTVFAHGIRYLKDHLLNHLKVKGLDVLIEEDDDIHWVLTIPAIWNDKSKQFMREAAQEAGIESQNLSLALEPEAAALYCRMLPLERLSTASSTNLSMFQPGTRYMVLDLGELPNLNILEREEVVDGGEVTTSEDWKEGRRVVELGVLAEGLRGCCKCGLPLQLSHTISVLTHGLASLLKVCCSNTKCNHINHVKTGKKHGKVWDVNTKLSAAMVHVGIGVTQVNSLLSELNIPPVSHAMLDNRQKEIGRAVQDVAAESMSNALQKELGMMNEEMNEKGLVVAVDAGWQKRGSGKTYDSLSGHCSMVGPLSGKVLSYSVRSKNCRVCSVAETTNKNPAAHECSKNWEGSSKAMEADMVIEMVEDLQKSEGITIDGIIGDEDTTTIARLKTNVNANIKKLSDKNHLKKLFTNSLFTLKKEHSSLTLSVIKYIQKCFSYSIAQGKGNALQIQEDLSSIPYHIFGDHEHCSARWCKFIDNPNLRYKSLPHGKPLKDRFLQDDLKEVFSSYASHSDRLSCLGSTQSNESFNRMVSAKAPKTHHYSSSSSLRYRVAACVAQKNEGHRYLIKVNKKLGLSPGYYTRRQCILRDLQRKRQKAISMTQKFKRRRRELKAKRIQSLSTKETREGVSYLTGCDLHHASDIDEIPAPKTIPKYDHLPSSQLLNAEEIYFDLETTGLGGTVDVTVQEVLSDYTLKELHKASGGAWGGTKIDEAFIQMIMGIVGSPVMLNFKKNHPADNLELVREFETKKRSVSTNVKEKITFRIPVALVEIFEDEYDEDLKSTISQTRHKDKLMWKGDKLRMNGEIVHELFKNCCESIVNHVKELLVHPFCDGVENILMVGGFSECKLIQEAIKNNFKNNRVIIPEEAGLAIVKGAVLFGHNPKTIVSRKTKWTYGVQSNRNFESGDPPEKRFKVGGIDKCRDIFSVHVGVNETVEVGTPLESRYYSPLHKDSDTVDIPIYVSSERYPKYTTDCTCSYVGKMSVDLEKSNNDREIEVKMTFGGTELIVEAKDTASGNPRKAKFNFLETDNLTK